MHLILSDKIAPYKNYTDLKAEVMLKDYNPVKFCPGARFMVAYISNTVSILYYLVVH